MVFKRHALGPANNVDHHFGEEQQGKMTADISKK